MPNAPRILKNGFVYHIYNRGVEKRDVFPDHTYYIRFLKTLSYYQKEEPVKLFLKLRGGAKENQPETGRSLVTVLCYCLMPNHFHLVVKQINEGGITKYMNCVANSYTRYFNTRLDRVGPLFQGTFKAKLIDSSESFMQVTRYIHLNPQELSFHLPGGTKGYRDYPYSSYPAYIDDDREDGLCDKEAIRELIMLSPAYREFVDAKALTEASQGIEHIIIE